MGVGERLGRTGPRIGFIGFGAVASTFARAMAARGVEVYAYDLLLEGEGGRETLARRAGESGVRFLPAAEVAGRVDLVLSTAATHVALDIARAWSAHLGPGQTYVDLNSTAPQVKVAIGEVLAPSGVTFVEGAIMGAVGATGAETRILLGGACAGETADALRQAGLNAEAYSEEVGRASTFKMLRSILAKGLEALLIEFMVSAHRAGMADELWDELARMTARVPFERLAANWVQTHPVAYERRYHEMVQVAETMRGLGIEPLITAGTLGVFERSRTLGLDRAFPERPESVGEVIAFVDAQLEA
jgi:3-hydroxyisobutyrate dehydrogenase-like beta-hydroxyacid dehydrogenase